MNYIREREREGGGEEERKGEGEREGRETIEIGKLKAACVDILNHSFILFLNSLEMDVCSELGVECGGHSKCRNAPDSEDGYECVCDSGYERKGDSCSLIGWDI